MVKKMGLVVFVLVSLFVVAGVAMATSCTSEEAAKAESATMEVSASVPAAAAVTVGNKVCPVTGETIAELGKDTVEYEGKVYNLCCPDCKEKFLADPAKYIAIVGAEIAAPAADAAVPAAVEAAAPAEGK